MLPEWEKAPKDFGVSQGFSNIVLTNKYNMTNIHKSDKEFNSYKMPFGQYRGMTISKIKDKPYLRWAFKNMKLMPHLKYAVMVAADLPNTRL